MALRGLKRVTRAIEKHVKQYNDEVRAIYIKTLGDVIYGTPVHFQDGGRLKNSWSLSVGNSQGRERSANRGGGGSYDSLATMPIDVLGKTLYFTNPMPYANVVEYGGYPKKPKQGTYIGNGQYQNLSRRGFSIQAPAGMARINLNIARRKVKNL